MILQCWFHILQLLFSPSCCYSSWTSAWASHYCAYTKGALLRLAWEISRSPSPLWNICFSSFLDWVITLLYIQFWSWLFQPLSCCSSTQMCQRDCSCSCGLRKSFNSSFIVWTLKINGRNYSTDFSRKESKFPISVKDLKYLKNLKCYSCYNPKLILVLCVSENRVSFLWWIQSSYYN